MTVLPMDPAKLPATGRALFADMSARRNARGERFGGPYIALLNHPELARRIEALGFFLKFEGVLPRPDYQFIVLSVAQATGAAYEWHDHVQHALAAGLPQDVVDDIAADRAEMLPPSSRCYGPSCRRQWRGSRCRTTSRLAPSPSGAPKDWLRLLWCRDFIRCLPQSIKASRSNLRPPPDAAGGRPRRKIHDQYVRAPGQHQRGLDLTSSSSAWFWRWI